MLRCSRLSRPGTFSFSRWNFRFSIKCCHSLQTAAAKAQSKHVCCVMASKIMKRSSVGRRIQQNFAEERSLIPVGVAFLELSAIVTNARGTKAGSEWFLFSTEIMVARKRKLGTCFVGLFCGAAIHPEAVVLTALRHPSSWIFTGYRGKQSDSSCLTPKSSVVADFLSLLVILCKTPVHSVVSIGFKVPLYTLGGP